MLLLIAYFGAYHNFKHTPKTIEEAEAQRLAKEHEEQLIKQEKEKRRAEKWQKQDEKWRKIREKERLTKFAKDYGLAPFDCDYVDEDLKSKKLLELKHPSVNAKAGETFVFYSYDFVSRNKRYEYSGQLLLSDLRLLFIAQQRPVEVRWDTIDAIHRGADYFEIQRGSKTYVFVAPTEKLNQLAVAVIEGILNGLPISRVKKVRRKTENTASETKLIPSTVISGEDFEKYCADLLTKQNFEDVRVTKTSGDQGVEILAEKDGVRYAIQCKYYQQPLGNTPVQEITAGREFYDCDTGVVMTNSTFTPGARALAKKNKSDFGTKRPLKG